jgi:hypothetical protein
VIYAAVMRSGVALVLALGACGFRSSPAADDSPPPDDARPVRDAANGSDGPGGDAATGTGFCDPKDKNLVVCYEFEGNANDGSSHGLNAVTAGVTFPPGRVGMAMQSDPTTAANVPASAVFDVRALTIEAWILPTQIPAAASQDIIDVDTQYAFFINPDGTVTCDLHGTSLSRVTTTDKLVPNLWTHVACTYDGGTVSRIYFDGVLDTSKTGNGMLATGGNAMAIAGNSPSGSQLVGMIDQLRMMSVARSAKQICGDAGKSGCP